MKFSEIRDFILSTLVGSVYEGVFIHPGPDEGGTPPGRMVVLSSVGGPGLNTDDLFDGRSWQVLVVGDQESYDDAEGLAFAIDAVMVNFYSRKIGTRWVTSILRQGGPPTPLTVDDANRTRFTCTYAFDVRSAVA